MIELEIISFKLNVYYLSKSLETRGFNYFTGCGLISNTLIQRVLVPYQERTSRGH